MSGWIWWWTQPQQYYRRQTFTNYSTGKQHSLTLTDASYLVYTTSLLFIWQHLIFEKGFKHVVGGFRFIFGSHVSGTNDRYEVHAFELPEHATNIVLVFVETTYPPLSPGLHHGELKFLSEFANPVLGSSNWHISIDITRINPLKLRKDLRLYSQPSSMLDKSNSLLVDPFCRFDKGHRYMVARWKGQPN